MVNNTCIVCGKQFTSARRRKTCSKKCSNILYRRFNSECVCTVCGQRFIASRPGCTTCSNACKARKTMQTAGYKKLMEKRIGDAKARKARLALLPPKPEPTQEERYKTWLHQLSPLRRAWVEQDRTAFFKHLREDCIIDERSCWIWQRSCSKDGYAQVPLTTSKTKDPLHRAVCEMKYGKPLGTQQAHHICGNRHCVNPEHIVPVTAAQNVGEMLARTSYEQRINELTEELKRIDPNNEVLNRIAYGTTA